MNDINARSIDELPLLPRTSRVLKDHGILTIGALTQKTDTDLLRLIDFGRRSLRNTKEALAPLGLGLGMKTTTMKPMISDETGDYRLDPLLQELINRLPAPGLPWSLAEREDWQRAWNVCLSLVYPKTGVEDGGRQ